MVRMTWSLSNWFMKFHRDIYIPVSFGHLELFTEELQQEYIDWCKTDEGRSYLKGGSNYKEINND